jgi:hypothetical protein
MQLRATEAGLIALQVIEDVTTTVAQAVEPIEHFNAAVRVSLLRHCGKILFKTDLVAILFPDDKRFDRTLASQHFASNLLQSPVRVVHDLCIDCQQSTWMKLVQYIYPGRLQSILDDTNQLLSLDRLNTTPLAAHTASK